MPEAKEKEKKKPQALLPKVSPRGRARYQEGAQDVESWARTTNMLQVASGRLGRSGFLVGIR